MGYGRTNAFSLSGGGGGGGGGGNTLLLMHFDNNLTVNGTELTAFRCKSMWGELSFGSWTYGEGETAYPSGKFGNGLQIPKLSDPELDEEQEMLMLPIDFGFHTSPDPAAVDLVPATFTIEFFIKLGDNASTGSVMSCYGGGALSEFKISSTGTNTWEVSYYDNGISNRKVSGTFTNDGNSFTHIAIVQTSSSKYLFIGGALVSTNGALGSNGSSDHNPLAFGMVPGAVFDELRISNIARYTTTFTPPSSPFTVD